MRGYQLVKMFGDERPSRQRPARPISGEVITNDTLSELKVGKIAQTFLRDALESGKADDEEISLMRTKDYSKRIFGIDFPLLVLANEDFDPLRYYIKPLSLRGKQYRLSSQWFESSANNDRPLLLAWLNEHTELKVDSTSNEL